MQNERFNMSLRRFLKEVGISSQQEIERIVRERELMGGGKLKVKMVLTAAGTDLRHRWTARSSWASRHDAARTDCYADLCRPDSDDFRKVRHQLKFSSSD
jgi:hypothetical protein